MMNVTDLVKAIEILAPNMEVEVCSVQKGNVTLTGISVGNGNIRPTVYVEHFEETYEKAGYIAVAKEMLAVVEDAIQNSLPKIGEVNGIHTWKFAKNNLRLCIAPKGTNEGYVVYPYLDLELYVRVILSKDDFGVASYKVKNDILKSWGITEEELLHKAMESTKTLYNTIPMGEMMYEMTGNPMFLDEPLPIIVANTSDGYNGASIMYCKEILKEVADKWESDLIIIPSSIHECLLKPLDGMTPEEVTKIINEINENEVDPEEVLSNHAYIFHRDTMEFTW